MAAPCILLPITVTGQQLVRWELPSGSDTSRWPRVLQTPSHVVPKSTEGKPAPSTSQQGWTHCQHPSCPSISTHIPWQPQRALPQGAHSAFGSRSPHSEEKGPGFAHRV